MATDCNSLINNFKINCKHLYIDCSIDADTLKNIYAENCIELTAKINKNSITRDKNGQYIIELPENNFPNLKTFKVNGIEWKKDKKITRPGHVCWTT